MSIIAFLGLSLAINPPDAEGLWLKHDATGLMVAAYRTDAEGYVLAYRRDVRRELPAHDFALSYQARAVCLQFCWLRRNDAGFWVQDARLWTIPLEIP